MLFRRSLIFYLTSEVFLSVGLGIVSYAQPFYYHQVGQSDAHIGFLFASNAAVAGLSALILGPLADRHGVLKSFKMSTFILPFGYVWMAFTHSMSTLYLTAAMTGLGGALLMSTENVVMSNLLKDYARTSVLSKFVAFYTVAMGAGVVLSGFLCSLIGYEQTMRIGALLAAIAPFIRLFVRVADTRAHTVFWLPSKRLMAMGGYAGLFGIATGVLSPFVTMILKSQFAFSNHSASVVSAVSLFITAFGSYLVVFFLRRFNRSGTLLLGLVGGALITLLLSVLFLPAYFLIAYFARTLLLSVPGSVVDATFLDLSPPSEYAQMFGIRVFGNSVGSAVGSFVGGILLSSSQTTVTFLISGLVFVASYIYLVILLRRSS